MYKLPLSARIVFSIYLLLIAVHICSWLNIDPSQGHISPHIFTAIFFLCLFPFWLTLILKSNKHFNFSNKSFVMHQIKNSLPNWILRLVIFNFAYALANFFTFFITAELIKKPESEFQLLRVFTGHISVFYIVAFAGLTALANYKAKLCMNGHEIRTEAQYCPQCGIKLN